MTAGGRPPTPVVDPPHQTVTEGEAASFRCWVPGIPDCQMTWHKVREFEARKLRFFTSIERGLRALNSDVVNIFGKYEIAKLLIGLLGIKNKIQILIVKKINKYCF